MSPDNFHATGSHPTNGPASRQRPSNGRRQSKKGENRVTPILEVRGWLRSLSAWRQAALARIAELQTYLEWTGDKSDSTRNSPALVNGAERQITAAEQAAAGRSRGAAEERTWSNMHAAETALLELAPRDQLPAYGVDILASAKQHLGTSDPLRRAMEDLLERRQGAKLTEFELDEQHRELAVRTLRATHTAADNERRRARSFRNVVCVAIVIMTFIAIGLAVLGWWFPEYLPMCFTPEKEVVCASGGIWGRDKPAPLDTFLIEVVGTTAASLTAAISVRRIWGTATPYQIPSVLTILKLPAGAIAAVLGITLVRAGIVPGLSDLDTPAQILGWAAIFGVAQQSLTHFVDERGQKVLDAVRGPTRAPTVGADAYEARTAIQSRPPEAPSAPT